jgi:phage portal protein BeeE
MARGTAWLFVRGAESIHMTTLLLSHTLLVCGPGTSEHAHRFETNEALESFRRAQEEQLLREGWTLSHERRGKAKEPPTQEHRREVRVGAV